MTATNTNQKPEIEVIMFDTPSGSVRGTISAFVKTKKGGSCSMNTLLMTDKPAELTIKMPSRLSADDLENIIPVLQDFVTKVRDLDTQG